MCALVRARAQVLVRWDVPLSYPLRLPGNLRHETEAQLP